MNTDETTHTKTEAAEWERQFVEEGAALEHERWAAWQAYLHSKCVEHSNGEGKWVCFPAELFARWERQIATRYVDLSEAEKESDRREARTYLPLVGHQRQQAVAEFAREVVALTRYDDWPHVGITETPVGDFVKIENIRTLAKQYGVDV